MITKFKIFEKIKGDPYKKLQFCRVCDEQTLHLNDKCITCEKRRKTERERKGRYDIGLDNMKYKKAKS